jgi:hypothetical protein
MFLSELKANDVRMFIEALGRYAITIHEKEDATLYINLQSNMVDIFKDMVKKEEMEHWEATKQRENFPATTGGSLIGLMNPTNTSTYNITFPHLTSSSNGTIIGKPQQQQQAEAPHPSTDNNTPKKSLIAHASEKALRQWTKAINNRRPQISINPIYTSDKVRKAVAEAAQSAKMSDEKAKPKAKRKRKRNKTKVPRRPNRSPAAARKKSRFPPKD